MLTLEQQACNFQTMLHIARVRELLGKMIVELLHRGDIHDQSKLASPEVELFTEWTPRLAACDYDSPEYHGMKAKLQPALDHHYANNRHHPEHHKRGIRDMNLLDLLEMFCDWKAASERHNTGNIRKSIEVNGRRFAMPPELIEIFENSVDLL